MLALKNCLRLSIQPFSNYIDISIEKSMGEGVFSNVASLIINSSSISSYTNINLSYIYEHLDSEHKPLFVEAFGSLDDLKINGVSGIKNMRILSVTPENSSLTYNFNTANPNMPVVSQANDTYWVYFVGYTDISLNLVDIGSDVPVPSDVAHGLQQIAQRVQIIAQNSQSGGSGSVDLSGVVTAINSVATNNANIKTSLDTVKTSVDSVKTSVDTVKTSVDSVATATTAVKNSIKASV